MLILYTLGLFLFLNGNLYRRSISKLVLAEILCYKKLYPFGLYKRGLIQ